MTDAFRTFRVVEKHRESSVIMSFRLVSTDGGPLWPAKPGQYLTLRVPSPDGDLLKTYSISSCVDEQSYYRITIKREAAPNSDVLNGFGSRWLHDEVREGDKIEIAAPRGHFVLVEESNRPVVLLSGGVGQTPLLSMLHTLAKGSRDVWYLHACYNGDVHAMEGEVAELVSQAQGRIQAYTIYENPSDADRESSKFSHEGIIDRAYLQSLLPLDDYDFYMCGPTPFMVAMYRHLTDLGVDKTRIAYEFFGKSQSLEALARSVPMVKRFEMHHPANAPAAIANLAYLTDPDARAIVDDQPFNDIPGTEHPTEADDTIKESKDTGDVLFAKSEKVAKWEANSMSLLDLAETAGLSPEFSCRSGICNSCKCRLKEGEVEYFEEPLDPPASGEVLICCARPKGRVVLDL